MDKLLDITDTVTWSSDSDAAAAAGRSTDRLRPTERVGAQRRWCGPTRSPRQGNDTRTRSFGSRFSWQLHPTPAAPSGGTTRPWLPGTCRPPPTPALSTTSGSTGIQPPNPDRLRIQAQPDAPRVYLACLWGSMNKGRRDGLPGYLGALADELVSLDPSRCGPPWPGPRGGTAHTGTPARTRRRCASG